MQNSVMNWDEVQEAQMSSPNRTPLTRAGATMTPIRGCTPEHPPSDGSGHLPQEVLLGNRGASATSSL